MLNLVFFWFCTVFLSLFVYVVLDGFILGAATNLFWLNKNERHIIVSSLVPLWDINQTWFILLLSILYGIFSLSFSIIFVSYYLLVIFLSVALLLRGVFFEFRLKSKNKKSWDIVFFISSLLAILFQSFLIKSLIIQNVFFSVSIKILLVLTIYLIYSLLGGIWIFCKTLKNSKLNIKTIKLLRVYLYSFILCIIFISNLGILLQIYFPINFTYKYFLLVAVNCFLLVLVKFFLLIEFFYYISLYFNLIICVYPYIFPYTVIYSDSVVNLQTLKFVFISVIFMFPILLFYLSYTYYVFRGKIVYLRRT